MFGEILYIPPLTKETCYCKGKPELTDYTHGTLWQCECSNIFRAGRTMWVKMYKKDINKFLKKHPELISDSDDFLFRISRGS